MTTHIRLLRRNPDGRHTFELFAKGSEPRYAILSHTWGGGEVTYDDMLSDIAASSIVSDSTPLAVSIARSKDGWRKVQFCADQARAHDLPYFWLDTCCIDKRNLVELQAAINSMWRWYKGAAKCYVYLSDVSMRTADGQNSHIEWRSALRNSRWFTRGWTLQELIAPRVVEFFSREGVRLGDKSSMQELIYGVTGINSRALQGYDMDEFSVNERLGWADNRTTTEEEDMAYCMLGMFGVTLMANYGEGREEAERRLKDKIREQKCYLPKNTRRYFVPVNLIDVPAAREFIDRPEMEEIEAVLLPHKQSPQPGQHGKWHQRQRRKVFVLRGLGGIGKTQLAREYADRHRDRYSAIMWVDGSSEETVKQSIARWASELPADQVSEASREYARGGGGDMDAAVREVLGWLALRDNTGWLLVMDNVDREWAAGCSDAQAYDVKRYFPRAEHGAIVVTTRLAWLEQLGSSRRAGLVGKVDNDTALTILRSWYNIEPDIDILDELLVLLDGLPLALAQAGAYLAQSGVGVQAYVIFYQRQWDRLHTLQEADGALAQEYPDRTVATTWTISFEAIRDKSPQAANLLLLWSHMSNRDLWYELFDRVKSYTIDISEELGELVGDVVTDKLAFATAMQLLRGYSMIEDVERAGSYSTHAVVHRWARHHQSTEVGTRLRRLAVGVVGWAVPTSLERDYASAQRRLLPHAEACEQAGEGSAMVAKDLTTYVARSEGEIAEGRAELLDAMYLLGFLYADQGKLAEAEQMYTRALQGYEEALGAKHTSTLQTVHSLGVLYKNQGKLAEAEQMYTRALQGYEEALGTKHTSTLDIVHNLGVLYKNQGKLIEAEQMYTRALQGYEEALGAKHTSTLHTVHNLGVLYAEQGKLTEAEQMYTRALQGYEQALGSTQLLTYRPALNTRWALGDLRRAQGKDGEAKQHYTDAMAGFSALSGPSSSECRRLQEVLSSLAISERRT